MTHRVPHDLGDGRFTQLTRLGEGGFGVVYSAKDNAPDKTANKKVAIKLLHRFDDDALRRFRDEFYVLEELFKRLNHPNLVRLHELLRFRAEWLFTMELVRGTDFVSHTSCSAGSRSSSGRGTLPRECDVTLLRSALKELVTAVNAIHDNDVLH